MDGGTGQGPTTVVVLGAVGSGRHTLVAALEPLVDGAQWSHDATRLSGSTADCVLVVTASALQGMDGSVAEAWERAAESAVPRILVITHLDVGRVDDDEMRLIAERILGEDLLPLHLPLADDDEEIAGLLTLTTMVIHDEANGLVREADAEHREIAGPARDRLLEAVVANTAEESLVANALLGLDPSPERLDAEFHELVSAGVLAVAVPVVAAPLDGRPVVGVEALAALLRRVTGPHSA